MRNKDESVLWDSTPGILKSGKMKHRLDQEEINMDGQELARKNKSMANRIMTRMTALTIFSVTTLCRMLSDDKEAWDQPCRLARIILMLDLIAGLVDSVLDIIQIIRRER